MTKRYITISYVTFIAHAALQSSE